MSEARAISESERVRMLMRPHTSMSLSHTVNATGREIIENQRAD